MASRRGIREGGLFIREFYRVRGEGVVEYSESFSVNFVLKYNPAHGMTMTTKFIFLLVGKKGGGGLRREERDGMGGYLERRAS